MCGPSPAPWPCANPHATIKRARFRSALPCPDSQPVPPPVLAASRRLAGFLGCLLRETSPLDSGLAATVENLRRVRGETWRTHSCVPRRDSLENPPAQAAASRVTLYPWASSLRTPPIFILRCAPQRMPTRLGACAWTVASANKRREKSRRGTHECVRHACADGPPHERCGFSSR